ncbi:hypothetical protein HDU87_007752 [Geranomyces variabilis]|uniref:Uncharacterized protein n=1 Tax=Geranomyces variabilis TaxID=109894 RepID=A0AAD5TFD1_9FUNG|nr:hypothetical protein HDU87_007752 [Geranomyces variabilis]
MHNLYLFRNLQTARVLVSPTFRMQNAILAQIGEHRAENKLRGDHWVPFAVLTGIQNPTTVAALQHRLVRTTQPAHAGGRYKLPLPEVKRIPFAPRAAKPEDPLALQPASVLHASPTRRPPLRQWEVPASVDEKMRELCRALIVAPEVLAETADDSADFDSPNRYTLWCERDEYWHRVEESGQAGLLWPEFVDHKRLRLLRNRYPLVPGFDPKTLADSPIAAPAEARHPGLVDA